MITARLRAVRIIVCRKRSGKNELRSTARRATSSGRSPGRRLESKQEPSLDPETRLEQALAYLRNAEAGGDGKARWQQYMLLAQLGVVYHFNP